MPAFWLAVHTTFPMLKVLCRPLFLGAWRSSTPTCQPCVNPCHLLPEKRRLWQPTSTRASRCAPAPPLSPSEDRLANVLKVVWGGFWGGFLERKFWGGFRGGFFDGFFAGFFFVALRRSPCGLRAKKIRKKIRTKIRTKICTEKSAPKNPHRKIRTEKSAPKNPHKKSAPKIRAKNPHTKIRTPHTKLHTHKESVHETQICFDHNLNHDTRKGRQTTHMDTLRYSFFSAANTNF